jgi:TolB-like protein
MSFFEELKRRNVVRVAIAYVVAAWLLLQLTEVLTGLLEVQSDIGKIVVILLVVGFIPVVIFAWAFELTPEGVKREKDIDRGQSITPQTGKKLDRIIIAGLVLVIVAMGIERVWFAGQAEDLSQADEPGLTEVAAPATSPDGADDTAGGAAHQASVAVLPFTAMSSGEDDEYFADGLTEEILNSLAGLPELLVTARTSSFHFKGRDLPIPEIARTLGVDHVVEGSVRRAGERVRITAQLIRAEDGFHLWSDTYDRTLEDVFAVQEKIAENIAETLDVVLDEEKRKMMRDAGIGDVEAFIAYQKALAAFDAAHSTNDPTTNLPEANRWFDAALAVAPNISNAHYLRTDLPGHILYDHAANLRSSSEAELAQALEEIQTGLANAVRSAPTDRQRAVLEVERIAFSDDWTGMTERIGRALEPGDCVRSNWMPDFAAPYGWAQEVVEHAHDEVRCDPISSTAATMKIIWLTWADRAEEALAFADQWLTSVGHNPWVDDARFFALLDLPGVADRPEMFARNPDGSFNLVPRKISAYAMAGDLDAARQVLADWQAEHTVDDLSLLMVSAALGDHAAANAAAARIDARVGGAFVLAEAVKACACGAPFDLSVTPHFRARIEESGLNWPPTSPLEYPAKDW